MGQVMRPNVELNGTPPIGGASIRKLGSASLLACWRVMQSFVYCRVAMEASAKVGLVVCLFASSIKLLETLLRQ